MISSIFSYFKWHYSTALNDFLRISKTLLWFVFHFFSISTLTQTLFSPWQKLNERYKGGFDITSFFETFVVNTITRIIGFVVRATLIVIGILVLIVSFMLEICVFVVWLVLPFIIILLFISGIRLLM